MGACICDTGTLFVDPSVGLGGLADTQGGRGTGAVDVATGVTKEDADTLRRVALIVDTHHPAAFIETMRIHKISCEASVYGLGNIARRPEGAHSAVDVSAEGGAVLGEVYRWLGSLGRQAPLPDLQRQRILVEAFSVDQVLLEHPADLIQVLGNAIGKSWGKHIFQALGVAGNTAFWGSIIEAAGDDDQQVLDRQRQKAVQRADQKGASVFSRAGDDIMDGLRGAVNRPLEGARKDGMHGFFKGVHSGALGLLAKPVVGVMSIGHHLHDRAGSKSMRIRAARAVYSDLRLRPFDATEAYVYASILREGEALIGAIKALPLLSTKASSLRSSVEADAKARASAAASASSWGLGGLAGGNGGVGLFGGLMPVLGGRGGAASDATNSVSGPALVLVATSQRVTLTWARQEDAASAATAAAASAAAAKTLVATDILPLGGWEVKLQEVEGVQMLEDGFVQVETKRPARLCARADKDDCVLMQTFCQRLRLALNSAT